MFGEFNSDEEYKSGHVDILDSVSREHLELKG